MSDHRALIEESRRHLEMAFYLKDYPITTDLMARLADALEGILPVVEYPLATIAALTRQTEAAEHERDRALEQRDQAEHQRDAAREKAEAADAVVRSLAELHSSVVHPGNCYNHGLAVGRVLLAAGFGLKVDPKLAQPHPADCECAPCWQRGNYAPGTGD